MDKKQSTQTKFCDIKIQKKLKIMQLLKIFVKLQLKKTKKKKKGILVIMF